MKTALIATAILAIASTIVSLSFTVKTLISERARVKAEQQTIDEQVKRARQAPAPKIVTVNTASIQVDGSRFQLN